MNKTKNLVLAALLTALSLLITFLPFKIVLGPFSMTPASHTPTMLAMFINPWVALFTVIGSCIGFTTLNPVVVIRAASHIIFALVGIYMMDKKKVNIFATIIVTSILHALAEGLIVYLFTPLFLPDKQVTAALVGITVGGTMVQHYVDTLITVPILYALTKAKLIRTNVFVKKSAKISM